MLSQATPPVPLVDRARTDAEGPGALRELRCERASWIEIAAGAIRDNLRLIRRLAGTARVYAVCKGDAYGFDAATVACRAVACFDLRPSPHVRCVRRTVLHRRPSPSPPRRLQ